MQYTVNTEAHPKFLLVRFHVNVAGATLDCVGQDQVDQLDDRSFIGRLFQVGQLHLLFLSLQFDIRIPQVGHRLHYSFEVFLIAGPVGLFDSRVNRAFGSHHRLDIETGHELDIVHGEHVGGIDHGNGQRSTYSAQGQNLITLGRLERNELYDPGVNFEVRKINGGHAVLARQKVGDVFVGEVGQLHQS